MIIPQKRSSRAAIRLLEEGTIALAGIENNGIMVDRKRLKNAIHSTAATMTELQAELENDERIYKPLKDKFGAKANIGSRDQMRWLLFTHLKHKPLKATATGRDSVDKDTLNHIDEPFVRTFLKREELRKINSTYLLALERELVKHDDGCWYVHPIYNLNAAVTYRSGAQLINIQNQPIRNKEMADIIRSCFVAPPDYHFAEVDFSGIEVRVGCCIHKDPNMIRYIKDPTTDMHRDQAMRMFGLNKEEVNKRSTRDFSKNMFVFPEFYGSVYFQCAPNIWEAVNDKVRNARVGDAGITILKHLKRQGITRLGDCEPNADNGPDTFVNRVREVERQMWERDFPVFARWKRELWTRYQAEGGVTTRTGFRINLHMKRNEVLNIDTQGSAFHCLLWVLIQMTRWLKKNKMKSKVIGQVHDSCLGYAHKDEVQDYLGHLKWLMTEALVNEWKWLTVPLDSESELSDLGGSWAEKKVWVETSGLWEAEA